MAKTHKLIDKIGMTASSLCAVHCALAPLLITLAPLIGLGFIFEENFETTFILVTLGLAFLSTAWGFIKKHRSIEPVFLLLFGAAVLHIARLESFTQYIPEPFLMALGGVSIAISHYINLKLCHHCDSCEHQH